MSQYSKLQSCRWTRKSSGCKGKLKLPSLLLLTFLVLIAIPPSVFAVPVHNCSLARFRHARNLRYGHRNAIQPGSLVSFVPPLSASIFGSSDERSSAFTTAPIVASSSVSVAHTVSTTTMVIESPPIRPDTRTESNLVLASDSTITITPLAISNPITSTPTLHSISALIGTIVSDPPTLTLPPHAAPTSPSSNVGSLEHSSSSSSSSGSSAPPSSTPTSSPTQQQQYKLTILTALLLTLAISGALLAAFLIYRRAAQRKRARAPRREVELVDMAATRRARAVRDDLLHRSVARTGAGAGGGVSGGGWRVSRSSLDDILAATAVAGAASMGAGVVRESSRAATAVGTVREEENGGRSRGAEKGGGEEGGGGVSGGGGDGNRYVGEWETLPPYVRYERG